MPTLFRNWCELFWKITLDTSCTLDAGISPSATSKASSSNQSELREQLAAEATAAVQGELDQLRKKCEEAEEQQARTQRELEEYKKITEKNSKEMEETNEIGRAHV